MQLRNSHAERQEIGHTEWSTLAVRFEFVAEPALTVVDDCSFAHNVGNYHSGWRTEGES